MKVINIHTRIVNQPKNKIEELFKTLSSKTDMMLATDKWSPMILDNGLEIGSKGGHGPIKYTVTKYLPDNLIQFDFIEPIGFNGYHKFEIIEQDKNATLIQHTINMNTKGSATLKWLFTIRWLHNAYTEDAFDKVENHFTRDKKISNWTFWVKMLRQILNPKKK